ncbi:Rieske 2Fe-2S domain-containing protein [uncultured Pseudokineococcus sp.]|uniref:Rieske (2Fe-2S) protein n=1 Tax=uncultured Pseudokineococcus sp. TaxID=1642928 RepID=UPI002633983A|nr:Rieske 2Fe-2S domain-containing protein [uncultured Pseudokineococcus sp.]
MSAATGVTTAAPRSTTSAPGAAGVDVGPLEDFAVGEGRAVVVQGRQVAVFRHRDGRLSALDAVCPHSGGPLADGQMDDRVVVCPLHLNVFELATGRSCSGQRDVAAHVAVVADGRVRVVLGGGRPDLAGAAPR